MSPEPPQDPTLANPIPPTAGESRATHEHAGDQIGPYRLLSSLGEGGFGTVWLAERREPFVQRVALKVIKPGMDSRAVLGRFEQERQALALMQHPNIARVLDGGLTGHGRPYFVMEYVKGQPITEFCDARRLTLRERLVLFQRVCEAMQHAHLKGVIHRDLKPGNILAFDVEGQAPSVKVIDFGVAKATAAASTTHTVFTESGQMIGTPEYMSPEQADARAAEIDTRSDIYSLGAVLYELLAGVLPLEVRAVREQGYRAVQRYIAETEPMPPSARLAEMRDTSLKSRILQARRESDTELRRRLRHELEWIPLLAMRKEPQNRYQSAMELARDVERYLTGQALQAGPPSLRYRLGKMARRHRALVTGISAATAALLLGLGLALWQWKVAEAARSMAERTAAEATAVKDFVIQSLVSADPMQGGRRDFSVNQAMVQAIARLDQGQLRDQPEAEAELQRAIAMILQGNADLELAAAIASRAVETMRRQTEGAPATLAACLDTLGTVKMAQGRYVDAEALYREALDLRQASLGPMDAAVGSSLNNIAEVCRLTGRTEEAVPLYERAIAIQSAVLGSDAEPVAQAVNNLAIVRVDQGRFADAEALFRRALDARQRTLGGSHPKTASAISNLGAVLDVMGRPEQARPLYEQALAIREQVLGSDHPHVADALNNLGSCETSLGRHEQAAIHYARALAIWERTLGTGHPDVALALDNLASARMHIGQSDQARVDLMRALDIKRATLGPDHPELASSLRTLGRIHTQGGDHVAAETLHRQSLDLLLKAHGADHPETGEQMHWVAVALLAQGRATEALPLERQAIEIVTRAHGETFPPLSASWETLADIHAALGEQDQARAARQRSIGVRDGIPR
jgi:serine/threonine protein kinase/Tfp pilus assembly protein PilF